MNLMVLLNTLEKYSEKLEQDLKVVVTKRFKLIEEKPDYGLAIFARYVCLYTYIYTYVYGKITYKLTIQ